MIIWITTEIELPVSEYLLLKWEQLTGKECGPESWSRGMWDDPDEAGDIETLNSDESFLTLEGISPFPKEEAFDPQWK